MEQAAPRVTLTNPDKVLYPETGTTKKDVFNYYTEIAPYLLPHLLRRPVTRRVWPNGVAGTTFFAKEAGRGVPAWINRVPIEHKSGPKDYVLLDSADALAWDAQQAGLEIHVPQWRFQAADNSQTIPAMPPVIEPPDRMVIDLDPGEGATLADCAKVALRTREILAKMGLELFPVTSGSKGIHLYAPLPQPSKGDAPLTSDAVSALAKKLAKLLEAESPDSVISTMSKASRVGKVMVDWSQNNGKKTTITPYSLRGQTMPYVAAPRTWDEIAAPDLQQLTYQQVLARAQKHGDLLAGLLKDNKKTTKRIPQKADIHLEPETNKPKKSAKTKAETQTDAPVKHYPPMLAAMPTKDELKMLEHQGQQEDSAWGFEIKWDGYRAIAVISTDNGPSGQKNGKPQFQLWSRNGQNYTDIYPELSALAEQVAGPFPVVLDGEIVAFGANGRPSFADLQKHSVPVTFQCFDILQLGKKDLTKLPFTERRNLLEKTLTPTPPIHISPLLPYEDAMTISQQFKLEGVMAKRLAASYQPGIRSKDWLKIKHLQTQQLVIVGYKMYHAGEPNEATDAIGSLLLAIPNQKELRCVGRVGTGFTDADRKAVFRMLNSLTIGKPAAELTGVTKAEAKNMRWVQPQLTGMVEYGEWTTNPLDPAAKLRHPRWRGWAD